MPTINWRNTSENVSDVFTFFMDYAEYVDKHVDYVEELAVLYNIKVVDGSIVIGKENDSITKYKTFTCGLCDLAFDDEDELFLHFLEHHK